VAVAFSVSPVGHPQVVSFQHGHLRDTALRFGPCVAGWRSVPTFRIDHMPYGGSKDSGLGREGLRYSIEEMTEPRLLVLNLR